MEQTRPGLIVQRAVDDDGNRRVTDVLALGSYLMNQDVVQTDTEAELGSVIAAVKSAWAAATGKLYQRDVTGGWQRAGAYDWVTHNISDGNYIVPITATTWGDLTGMVASTVVPVGRTLDVEFKVPTFRANGIARLRLLINGQISDQTVSNGAWTGAKLTGSIVGTGAAVTINVQALIQAGDADVRADGTFAQLRSRVA